MTRKNVLPATILVATALVFATVFVVPSSIGIASANPCSTNGGGGGNGGPGGSSVLGPGGPGGSGGDGGDSGSIGECTIDISDSVLSEP
ncbi:MAG: hypothetical protein WA461_15145 [Nitrososphaeraceae archaeon]